MIPRAAKQAAEGAALVGLEYLGRIMRASAAIGVLIALAFIAAGMRTWAAGVMAGDLWSLANLYGVRMLVVRWIRPGIDSGRPRADGGFALALLVKFPLLYGIGYLMLRSGWFRIEGLVLGFVLPFAVSFVDALGRFAAERREATSR